MPRKKTVTRIEAYTTSGHVVSADNDDVDDTHHDVVRMKNAMVGNKPVKLAVLNREQIVFAAHVVQDA